jgi:multidrug transporter EmrE-like cation transporter
VTLLNFLLIVIGVLLNAVAQLFLKAGTTAIGGESMFSNGAGQAVLNVATEPHIIAGLGCYVVSVGVWIVALSRVDVSIAYPMLSIGYVVNAFAAWYLFGEAITPAKMAGILVIIAGVYIVAKS